MAEKEMNFSPRCQGVIKHVCNYISMLGQIFTVRVAEKQLCMVQGSIVP